jgi:hypothetical protein
MPSVLYTPGEPLLTAGTVLLPPIHAHKPLVRFVGWSVTVRTTLPLTLAEVALMVAVPAATALASPAALMVATPVALLVQVTVAVQSALVLLE